MVALIGPVVLSARFVVRPRTRQSACPRRRSPVGALRGSRADVLDAIQYGVGQPREDGDADLFFFSVRVFLKKKKKKKRFPSPGLEPGSAE